MPTSASPPPQDAALLDVERKHTMALLRNHAGLCLLPTNKIPKALESMIFWSNQSTDEGTELSWRLMDILVQNQVHIEATVLNQLVLGWTRRRHKLRSKGVLARLAEYEPHVQANIDTYRMILEAADHHGDLPEVLDMLHSAVAGMESSLDTEKMLKHIQQIRLNPGASFQIEHQQEHEHAHEPPKIATSPIDVENQLLAAGNEPLNKNFNLVLQTWVNSKEQPDRIATRCVEILRHMQGLYRQGHERAIPTLVTYSLVLTAIARTGRARQAETILKELLDVYQEHGYAIQQPNKMHFTAVMDAWAKSAEPDAPKHAWNLLQRMQRMATETNNPDLFPSTITYNTVLNALAQSRDAPAACALVQDMWTWYEQGNVHVKPTLDTYNTVLNALAETGAAVQADRILLELHTRYNQGDQDVRPNVACYNTVLKAWKNSGADDAAERAIDLLDEMERLAADERGLDTLPDRVSYTTVIHIWFKRGDKVNSPRIKALLKKRSRTGVAGDITMYNAYLDGLAKAGHCQEAQDLLDELCDNYFAGTSAIKPDVVTFNTVIAAWPPAEKAEAVFRQLMTLGPQLDIAPTVISFTTLITACAKSKCPEKAERHRQELRTVYSTTSDELLRPDRKLYTTVLRAWKLSGDPRALDKCYALVEDLKALHQSGVPNCNPDHMVYNTLLEVIAASPIPDKAERAHSILEEMKSKHIRINKFTLDCVLLACARRDPNATLASRERAFSIAHQAFHQLLQEYQPDHRVFQLFFRVASGLDRAKEVDEANTLCHKLGFSNAALQTRK